MKASFLEKRHHLTCLVVIEEATHKEVCACPGSAKSLWVGAMTANSDKKSRDYMDTRASGQYTKIH